MSINQFILSPNNFYIGFLIKSIIYRIDIILSYIYNSISSKNDIVKVDQPLTNNPNVGGFGQSETEIVLQNPARIQGLLVFFIFILLLQIFLVLKKKQFEKVQLFEMNF